MPSDPGGEEASSQGRSPDSVSRHFLSEGTDAAEERLAEVRKRSLRWRHSAQRRRDRKRFFLLLLLLAAVLYILWRQCGLYLTHGANGAP